MFLLILICSVNKERKNIYCISWSQYELKADYGPIINQQFQLFIKKTDQQLTWLAWKNLEEEGDNYKKEIPTTVDREGIYSLC
jgi:hypothetical protein